MASGLTELMFSTGDMRGIFSDSARVRRMLAFETALAAVQAEAGLLPPAAAAGIAHACETFRPDTDALAAEAREAGNIAIPFVKALTAHCEPEARGWLHWGATSQDVTDTALSLGLREAASVVDADLAQLGDALAGLARAHRDSPIPGRTLLQPALPITFGLKAAGWLDAVLECRTGFARSAREAIRLQFGGAVGTLSALGPAADEVRAGLGRRLDLPVPDIAWHTNRVALARLGAELAVLAGALAKMAGDVALLMQPEVAEVAEPAAPGRGGSSTMPQKRNPVAAAAVRAAHMRAAGLVSTLTMAMAHEHERAAGGWQAEWSAIPDLFLVVGGALRHMRDTMQGLEVDPARMRANLNLGYGTLMSESLMMALAPHIGRAEAHGLVAELARTALAQRASLGNLAAADSRIIRHLSREEIAEALDPGTYRGLAGETVDRVAERWSDHRKGES